jgi:hypothetical protein
MTVFRDVAPCSLVDVYRRFRGACCLHHQGTCKTSANVYQIARRKHLLRQTSSYSPRENLKSHQDDTVNDWCGRGGPLLGFRIHQTWRLPISLCSSYEKRCVCVRTHRHRWPHSKYCCSFQEKKHHRCWTAWRKIWLYVMDCAVSASRQGRVEIERA